MLHVRILFIDTSLHKPVVTFIKAQFSLGDKRGLSLGELIRPFCITILYHNLLLLTDVLQLHGIYLSESGFG